MGYGDFHAHTIFGRLTAVIICMVGVFLVSFVVVALTNLLSLTDGEGKVNIYIYIYIYIGANYSTEAFSKG